MSVTESSTTRGHLRRILAVGLVVVVAILAGAGGTMAYWARAVDEVTARQEQSLVARTIERRLERMTEDVTSATVWDDAYTHTVPTFDPEWAHTNFGQYYAEYMKHDRTIGFDQQGRLVYASEDGTVAPTASAEAFARALKPLVTRIETGEAALRRPGRPPALGLAAAVSATTVVRADGAIWLVTASNVVPETSGVRTGDAPGPIIVSARRVGPAFMADLEKDLGIVGARLVEGDEALAGPWAPLKDANGRTLARLTWVPAQPGVGVFMDVAPLFAAGLALIFLAGGLLAFSVNRALRTMAASDASLANTLTDLTAARDRAEAASVAKSQFLANISHEIRTPLNGVLGMAQIMERGDLDASQRDRLEIIRESGANLLALLNDVLDLAKIEAGKLEIARRPTDLAAVIAPVCEQFRPLAAEKGLAFGFVVEPEARGPWRLDGMRVAQVIGNLLSNAVKFTGNGHVALRVWLGDQGLEFTVIDTGPGIPPERLPDLFGKFNQLDASTTREFGGSGLGLAICRELVELMDGQMMVESRVGQGSSFSFRLPAESASSSEATAA